jgi:hypothetical protein
MPQVGKKAQGQSGAHKVWVVRHGHAPPRAANAQEKAIETRVRREGKKEIARQLED